MKRDGKRFEDCSDLHHYRVQLPWTPREFTLATLEVHPLTDEKLAQYGVDPDGTDQLTAGTVPACEMSPSAGGVMGDVDADFRHQLRFHQRDVQLFLAAPPGVERPARPRMTAPPSEREGRWPPHLPSGRGPWCGRRTEGALRCRTCRAAACAEMACCDVAPLLRSDA